MPGHSDLNTAIFTLKPNSESPSIVQLLTLSRLAMSTTVHREEVHVSVTVLVRVGIQVVPTLCINYLG